MPRGGNVKYLQGSNPNEALEIARRGGVRSGETRRKKRFFKDCVQHYVGAKSDADPKLSNLEAMVKALIKKVIDEQDVRAFDSLRDTAGEKPVTSNQVSVSGNLGDVEILRIPDNGRLY